jgi:hypothetical protein
MADFLVKRGGPTLITLVTPTEKGRACVHLPVTPHARAGRISVPDAHVAFIAPEHAKHLVRLASDAPELPATEAKTIPATPASKTRAEKIAG